MVLWLSSAPRIVLPTELQLAVLVAAPHTLMSGMQQLHGLFRKVTAQKKKIVLGFQTRWLGHHMKKAHLMGTLLPLNIPLPNLTFICTQAPPQTLAAVRPLLLYLNKYLASEQCCPDECQHVARVFAPLVFGAALEQGRSFTMSVGWTPQNVALPFEESSQPHMGGPHV